MPPTSQTKTFHSDAQASAKEQELIAQGFFKVSSLSKPGPGQYARRLSPSQALGTPAETQGLVLEWCPAT
jgi:hypothetical protein